MINYRAILLYYSKNNTITQIATICECSRPAVRKAIKRAKEINLQIPVSDSISDQDLYLMLYPKRGRKTGYYYPDFYLLDKDRKKRSFSKFRAWQKYCRVCAREGYKAYGKSRFYVLFELHFVKPFIRPRVSKNLFQVRIYDALAERFLKRYGVEHRVFLEFDQERTAWCSKLRLDKHKLWAI